VEIWTVDNISAPTSGVSPALSGNVTIDTNSSSPALKITQTGTGYALRVQDSTDPDSTSTVIDNTGKIGIGTISPSELLDVSGGNIALTSSGGTLYAKITPGASITDIAASGARALTLSTDSTERVRITDTGLVGIGKTPAAGVELDVVGDVAASVSMAAPTITASTALVSDTISERTSAAGVTIDGVLCKDSQVAPANRVITAGSTVTATGSSVTLASGLPNWVKRITVVMRGISENAAQSFNIQLGTSGGVVSSGYTATSNRVGSAGVNNGTSTSGFIVNNSDAAFFLDCVMTICLADPSAKSWVASHSGRNDGAFVVCGGGDVVLGADLTSVTAVPIGGASFDTGVFTIFYE
jgi:hypothetical protein